MFSALMTIVNGPYKRTQLSSSRCLGTSVMYSYMIEVFRAWARSSHMPSGISCARGTSLEPKIRRNELLILFTICHLFWSMSYYVSYLVRICRFLHVLLATRREYSVNAATDCLDAYDLHVDDSLISNFIVSSLQQKNTY